MSCKHQWDYIGTQTIGHNKIMCKNPQYAVWICPKCKKVRRIKIGKS